MQRVCFPRLPPLLILLACLGAGPVQAACTNPAGNEADIIYNKDYHTFEFCNGTNWKAWGAGGAGGGGGDAAFVTGEALGTIRNDFSGHVGFNVTIGGADITVTQLGRWVVSGNNQTHLLHIFDSGCGAVASVTVDTASAPAGAFLYGTLSSPVTLASGGTYYIMSDETHGGDQWYSADTTLSTTSAGAIAASAFSSCINDGTGAGHSHVPIDFKYH